MYPSKADVNGNIYEINTDFRVAIRCNEIAEDEKIGDLERTMAILFLLFGERAVDNFQDYDGLLKTAKKFLSCGKDEIEKNNKEPDMDFVEDMDYIEASFMSDYHIDLSEQKMHWWKFMKLMNGLSSSDMGNCCVLNRVRNLRTMDTHDIKDSKTKQKINEAKKSVALKKKRKKVEATEEQKNSARKLYEELGFIERS